MPHGVVAPEVGLEVVNEGRKRCFASVPCRRNAIVTDQVFRVGRVLVRMVRMMRYSLDRAFVRSLSETPVPPCRASNVVDAGGATMSRYEETVEPGEAEDAVDMALDSRIVCWSHTCY